MADLFRPAFADLREAALHLVAASHEVQLAGAALVRATDAVLAAKEEHEDLRETVHRLESLVLELRDRLDRR
jgi:predicted  nucleic acid-binding Zn-ribbon protein